MAVRLRAVTAPAVAAVNPRIVVSIRRSIGYTTASDGAQVPEYEVVANVRAQMQALSNDELKQVEGMNLQGNKQAMYLNGEWSGIVRADRLGGDLVALPDGTEWLVVTVLENWPNWTKLALCQQLPEAA